MKHWMIGMMLLIALRATNARADRVNNSAFLNTSYLNGKYLNGKYLNGKYLNTSLINGGYVAGAWVGGMTRGGEAIQYVGLDKSELFGWTIEYDWFGDAYWSYHAADWFVGAHVNATFVNPAGGDPVVADLRIDSFERAPQPDEDVTVYTLSTYVTDSPQIPGEWVPICGRDEQGAPVKAIPLQGIWSYQDGSYFGGSKISDSADAVTFACLNAALGKCAASHYENTLAYKPWVSQWMWLCDADGDCGWTYHQKDDFHQACTRMVRADYCGDGTTHTVSGMPIDVYDVLGRALDYTEAWFFEASWNADGATTFACSRVIPLDRGVCPVYRLPDVFGTTQHAIWHLCAMPGGEAPTLPDGDLMGNRTVDPFATELEFAPSFVPASI